MALNELKSFEISEIALTVIIIMFIGIRILAALPFSFALSLPCYLPFSDTLQVSIMLVILLVCQSFEVLHGAYY